MKNLIYLLLIFVLLFSCNTKKTSPTNKDNIKITKDVSYYKDNKDQPEKTKLNLIIPQNVVKPPVFIWIGQGAWAYVDRNKEMNICKRFAEKGIATISVGHRLSPALIWKPYRQEGIKHPEHIKDIAMAFKWVYEHAEKYGYDKENIFVGGYSSGGHLATLLAMDNRYLKKMGLTNKLIKAVVSVGGGFDIPKYKEELIKEDPNYEHNHINPVFGTTHKEHLDASPTTYIDSLITPLLIIADKDTYKYNKVFEEALLDKKAKDIEFLNIYNKTHGGLWRELGAKKYSRHRTFIVDYIKERSKPVELKNNSKLKK